MVILQSRSTPPDPQSKPVKTHDEMEIERRECDSLSQIESLKPYVFVLVQPVINFGMFARSPAASLNPQVRAMWLPR
jgi:hypothetical protein